jgi:hypothetical protein
MKRTRLERKTPLRRVGKKRQLKMQQRREFVAEQLAARPVCEAGSQIGAYRLEQYGMEYAIRLAVGSPCTTRAIEIHEPLTRARGGSILDVANSVALCRNCHRWIHDNPDAATEVGLLQPSWMDCPTTEPAPD